MQSKEVQESGEVILILLGTFDLWSHSLPPQHLFRSPNLWDQFCGNTFGRSKKATMVSNFRETFMLGSAFIGARRSGVV
ncbi:hypothetical protein TorRG33x02_318040 [Trema orientale]|uniref:Uncharacterized protein n=1 Tax=Trema orientale TaxID=63057 RepID=A0A2P5BKH8_TREOI|nr:hypothetical protein TorRG33x02_318040 [Trema orientale]